MAATFVQRTYMLENGLRKEVEAADGFHALTCAAVKAQL